MKKDIIFFDLDGTIVDSAPGIKESVKYALYALGIEENDEEKLNMFIGPPLFSAFSSIYNLNKEDADFVVNKYRENYSGNNAIEKFLVYDGVENMLKTLKEKGFTVCLATAKPLPFAERILKKANLLKYFDFVNGASFDESKRTKTAVIKDSISKKAFQKERILMVGDRENDVCGAKNNKISVLGVTYGYGDYEELSDAGCKDIVSSPYEVVNFIINQKEL